MTKTQRRNYYLLAALVVILSSVGGFMYYRNRNQKIVDAIMAVAEGTADPITGGGEKFGDSRDLKGSEIFDYHWWRKNPSKVSIWFSNADGSDGPAKKLAKQIHEAKFDLKRFQIRDYPEKIVSAFKTLKSKEDVSKLADVFYAMYDEDLYDFINESWVVNGCDADQDTCYFGAGTNYLKQIYDIIKKLK